MSATITWEQAIRQVMTDAKEPLDDTGELEPRAAALRGELRGTVGYDQALKRLVSAGTLKSVSPGRYVLA